MNISLLSKLWRIRKPPNWRTLALYQLHVIQKDHFCQHTCQHAQLELRNFAQYKFTYFLRGLSYWALMNSWWMDKWGGKQLLLSILQEPIAQWFRVNEPLTWSTPCSFGIKIIYKVEWFCWQENFVQWKNVFKGTHCLLINCF